MVETAGASVRICLPRRIDQSPPILVSNLFDLRKNGCKHQIMLIVMIVLRCKVSSIISLVLLWLFHPLLHERLLQGVGLGALGPKTPKEGLRREETLSRSQASARVGCSIRACWETPSENNSVKRTAEFE